MNDLTEANFQRSLAQFIRGLTGTSQRRHIRSTTLLFRRGLIDSLKILDLLAFVEGSLEITIPDQSVTLENFRNIKAISNCFWKHRNRYGRAEE